MSLPRRFSHLRSFENAGMSSLIEVVPLLILFAATTHSLAPPSPMQAITIPTSSTSSSLRLLNISSVADNVPFVNTTRDRVECISAYGYNMPRPSCEDVWENMPTDSEVLTFGARGQGHFERPLPYRYLSSKFNVLRLGVTVAFLADFPYPVDGLCAVEVVHSRSVIHDTASNQDISVATKAVIDSCVYREVGIRRHLGGVIRHVG